MLKKLLAVSAGLTFTVAVYAATVEWTEGHPDRYVVQKGDTLWDISARFLQKPWYWPQIWQANPQIRNPHRIYPGDTLVLAGGRVGLAQGDGALGPRVRGEGYEDAVPPVPLSALKQWLKNTRIVAEDAYKHAPHVVGIEENQLRGATGQLVYIRGLDAQWSEGLSPWTLTERGDRWYGRGVVDNKGQHLININGLRAVLETRGKLGFNAKYLIEMGEEAGSPGLRTLAAAERDALAADVLIGSDGPRLSAQRPTIFLGSRGAFPIDIWIEARAAESVTGCVFMRWPRLPSEP